MTLHWHHRYLTEYKELERQLMGGLQKDVAARGTPAVTETTRQVHSTQHRACHTIASTGVNGANSSHHPHLNIVHI